MTTRALVVYCHPDDESFVRAVRDRVVATLEARRRRGPGQRPVRGRVRSDVHRDRARDGTSSPEPIRRCRHTSTISCGATRSCSCTRRGGRASRRCSRDGSTASGSTGWRGASRPGADRLEPTADQRAPTRRRHHARIVEVGQCDRRRGRQAHAHAQPALDVSPARPDAWIAMYGVDTSSPERAGAIPRSWSSAG